MSGTFFYQPSIKLRLISAGPSPYSHMGVETVCLMYTVHCIVVTRSSFAASWGASHMDVVNVSNAWMQFLTKLSGGATAMVYMALVISLGTSAMDGKLALVYGYILAEVSILNRHRG